MRNVITVGLTVLAAVLVFTALRAIALPLPIGINVFTVAVISLGVFEGEIAGAVTGAVCGLVIDALSLGMFGLAGLTKTVTGFLAGFVSRKLNIQPPGRLFVFAGVLGIIDLALGVFLQAVVAAEGFPWARGWLLVQPAGTAVLVTAFVCLVRRIKARRER
jgi:rod shape-determining protein MreD